MKPPRLFLTVAIVGYFAYFGTYAIQRHLAFETGAFDLGVYAQPIWNYLQGHDFSVSLQDDNGPLRWANHIEPILFLILPIYTIWPDPRSLIWLQVAGLSLAAIPMYGLAARRLQNEWAACVVVLAYFLLPATQAVTLFDFHAVALAPLFLLSAIYYLDLALERRGYSFWLWPKRQSATSPTSYVLTPVWLYLLSTFFFLLALACKEDISLHVFMVGVYLLLLRRRWQEGIVLMVVGLLWFYVAFQIIMPLFRTGGGYSIHAVWFEALGDSPLEIVLSPVLAPDRVLTLVTRPDSILPLGMISIPLAFLPWAGLPLLALAAPSIALVLLSQNPTLRQLESWHYAAPMLPFIMLATMDGIARINDQLTRNNEQREQSRPTPGLPRPMLVLCLMLLSTSLLYQHYRGYSHLSKLSEWPEVTPHHQLGQEIAATLPPGASVLAQAQLVPHIAHRLELAIWSGPLVTDYDYIWLDVSHHKLPNRFGGQNNIIVDMIYEHAFGLVDTKDGYLLLQKGAERKPIGENFFTFTGYDTLPPGAQPFEATFGDALKLIGVRPEIRRLATSETEPQVVLYFETLQQPAEDYRLFIYLLAADGTIIGATDYDQPALVWWPTSRWGSGDRRQVRVNTVPWWTGDKSVFGYAIGLSRSDDPWDVSARLPVTLAASGANPPGSQPLDNNTLLLVAAFRHIAELPYPAQLTIINDQ